MDFSGDASPVSLALKSVQKSLREKEGTLPSGRIAYVPLILFLENHDEYIQLFFFFVGHEGEHFTSFLLPEQTTFSCDSQETSLKELRKTKQNKLRHTRSKAGSWKVLQVKERVGTKSAGTRLWHPRDSLWLSLSSLLHCGPAMNVLVDVNFTLKCFYQIHF